MASRKDNTALAAGAAAQVWMTHRTFVNHLLTLELFDKIADYLYVFSGPIEFSPIPHLQNPRHLAEMSLQSCQYQHALDFHKQIRPALRALRVCKAMFGIGVVRYYTRNLFRFSSQFGWLVMPKFFDLIGPSNTALLRDIAVVHPTIAASLSLQQVQSFFIDRLSPFGMADLKDFHHSFIHGKGAILEPARDTGTTLRQVSGLRHLSLLLYPQKIAYVHDSPTHPEMITWFVGLHLSRNSWSDFQPPAQATVMLVNMYRCYEVRPVFLEAMKNVKLEISDVDEGRAARRIIVEARSTGWPIKDTMFCDASGVWPVTEADFETSETEWVNIICEDYEGWFNRHNILRALNRYDHGPQQCTFYCVKYWRDKCICEDGVTYLEGDEDLKGPWHLKQGVPMEVDVEAGRVRCEWSQAIKDMEHRTKQPWFPVSADPEAWFWDGARGVADNEDLLVTESPSQQRPTRSG